MTGRILYTTTCHWGEFFMGGQTRFNLCGLHLYIYLTTTRLELFTDESLLTPCSCRVADSNVQPGTSGQHVCAKLRHVTMHFQKGLREWKKISICRDLYQKQPSTEIPYKTHFWQSSPMCTYRGLCFSPTQAGTNIH